MMSQPKIFNCTIQIDKVEADPAIPGKYYFSGKILEAEPGARENAFYAEGRGINGFTFHFTPHLKAGRVIKADLGFMGDPFNQHYELTNIEPVG